MKPNPIPLIAAFFLISFHCLSQADSANRLFLKTGSFIPEKNIDSGFTQEFNQRALRGEGQSFAIIQFEHIPTSTEKQLLLQSGITLVNYIPNNAYSVSIKGSINEKILHQVNARAVVELRPEQKMPFPLSIGIAPAWSVKVAGTADVWISFLKVFSYESVISELKRRNFDTTSTAYKNYHIICLRVPLQRLTELASLPFVEYVQPAPHEDQPLNNVDRSDSRANILNASTTVGGRNLKGQGVVIGIGDDADPQLNVDFTNRVISRTYAPPSATHGKHVAGTAGGAGIMNELYRGYSPKATLITQYFSGIWQNAPAYVQDYGMVLTNNSYAAITGDCSYNGLYDLYSSILDQQEIDFPYLQHVFAAGNSGADFCSPYPSGFETVLGSYQSAKNVLTVGATDSTGTVPTFSSKGPVKDGRLKPEITSMGQRVVSDGNGGYFYDSGTSMASPGVTGGLTLLYQLYKQLNSGNNPKSGLMKAIVCNSGRDGGNSGPDFSYGFGWMDLRRAAITIENNRYFTSTIANGIQNTHSMTIPANAAQLKVMLYWHDPPASLLSSQTLVNDLDLTVQTPSSTIVFPKILDTIPAHVTHVCTEGPDHINNIEQVVINNPQAGSYTINVNGNSITQNSPQEYFIAYDVVPDSTTLSFPIGGESFSTTDSALIQWDAFGTGSTFKLEYSTDDGVSWTTINSSIAGNLRQKKWIIPNITTDNAKIKLTNNTTGAVSISSDFTILGLPVVSLVTPICEGYIKIKWGSIPSSTDYEVFMLRGDDMQSMAIITDTSYTFSGLSKDSVYWVAVRARLNGNPGRRSVAVSRQPNTGTCAGNISDNDLKLDSILAPLSGRRFTSSELGNSVQIKVRIKNLDDVAISNFDVKYSVNGGAWISEHVASSVNGGTTYTHTFGTTYDFSSIGTYTLTAVVDYASDTVKVNDTLTAVIKQLDNQPVDLTTPFLENFDAAPQQQFKTAQTGLAGLDRFDFSNSTAFGRIRSFINSGIAYSGNNAITLDVDRYIYPSTNTNYLYGTFNLSNYNANTDDIRLDFYYNNHGQPSGSANAVWIRGSDTSSWVSAYDLFANQNDPGEYKKTSSIEISDLLTGAGQNFKPSFQIRWGQFGYLPTVDIANADGYTFEDIHLYKAIDDIQMISIDTPGVNSCGLNATTPIKVSVRNSVNTTISNIPVKFQVDGGSVISETIPSIGGNATVQYTFSTTANLSSPGTHAIEVWVDYPTDSYRQNDTANRTIVNSPVISSFPYLENFESGNGSWYPGGVRNSWEYGTPASNKINSAASGSKAWKTRLAGNYNDLELSYLYSPCFDISGMTNPTLSLSLALDLEDCGASLCDGAWVEYSADGITWNKLGAFGSGTNWYNKNYSGDQLWNIQNYTRWHVATSALPAGLSRLRLRIVMNSDPAVNREGIAVDDIHIYDNTMGIYNGVTLASPINQTISGGTSWIDFTSGGKLVASVQPNNQNMGSTNIQAYINTGAVRHASNQYYHDRNITIIPANNLTDSAIIRFYYLDSETEALLNATGCSSCSKPSSAYQLGVSKYTQPGNRSNEDGTLLNDSGGSWSFINSSQAIKVPFDKGYYAEFKVKDFSEFWLSNGGPSGLIALPLKILSFNAYKQNNNVLLEWKTAEELNIDHYEIEVARTSKEYQLNNFVRIGQVASHGNSSIPQDYDFTDAENNKTGVRYYRLKIIQNDGSVQYSEIRPVVFSNEITWHVYPNPSNGVFNFIFQQNADEIINLKVYNIKGQLVKQVQTPATGFVQKITIDLQQNKFASGMYMILAEGTSTEMFKVVKQ
ncbi:MAG: S8 family serine peptidase [Chitinophagales bacterium]